MTWYRGYYGNWKDLSFRRLPYDTTSRREILRLAREAAADTMKVVTVIAEKSTWKGLDLTTWKVLPDGRVTS